MAGSIPNKDKGIIATIDAHVLGQSIDAVGGYFTALTVGDKGILDKNLDSKIKGATGFKCAAFFTRLWIEHNAVIFFDVLVDATTGAKGNPAGIISSQIRAEQTKILFNGTVGAYQTTLGTTGAGNQDVLTSVTVKGQIWRSKDGTLHLDDLGEESFGQSHHLQKFRIGVLPDKETDLQLNFGGLAKGIWTVAPLS